jgi:hypothetical protein
VADQAPPGIVADPEKLIEYLVDRMLAGHEQDDDVTVLVLRMPVAPASQAAGQPRHGRR